MLRLLATRDDMSMSNERADPPAKLCVDFNVKWGSR
jgi:hypothetical protein